MFPDPRFRTLLISQTVSMIGDRITAVALVVLIYQMTGSGLTVGLLLMLRVVPQLFGPLTGVVVDRLSRKRIMVTAACLQGLTVLSMPVLPSVAALFAAYFTLGLLAQFYIPAISSTLPDLVPEDRLMSANSLFSVGYVGAIAIGPAICTLLIETVGLTAAFLVDAATFLVPAIAIALMPLPHRTRSDTPAPFTAELRAGLAYARATPAMVAVLVLMALVFAMIGAISVLGIVIADKVLGIGASGYGFMMSAMGFGMIAGAVYAGKWGKSADRLRLASTAAILAGTAICGLALANTLATAAVAAFVAGIGVVIVQTSASATFQSSPEAFRGRVVGLGQSTMAAANFTAMGMAGLTVDRFGPAAILLAAGLPAILGGLLFLSRANRAARHPANPS